MRIAVFCQSRIWGGLEVHALSLVDDLLASGHDAFIVCLGAPTMSLYEPRCPQGIRLVRVDPPRRRTVWGWWRALRDLEADVVVLEKGTLWTGGLSLDVVLRARFRRFLAIQQLEPPELPPRSSRPHVGGLIGGVGLWWYRWKVLGYLRSLAPATTICVSDAVRERLIADYAFDPRRLITIRNGVDSGKFRREADRRARARARWQLQDTTVVFGTVCRLVHHKGVDVAIEAFRRLLARRPEAEMHLLIVGDGAERSRLEAGATDLQRAGRVTFAGHIDDREAAFQAIDVFIMPSRSEALGIAVLEALAAECLVVATEVGGIPEILERADTGLLVPPENPDAMTESLEHGWLMPPELRQEMARKGREHVDTHFSSRMQTDRILELLSDLRVGASTTVQPDQSRLT